MKGFVLKCTVLKADWFKFVVLENIMFAGVCVCVCARACMHERALFSPYFLQAGAVKGLILHFCETLAFVFPRQ